MINFIKNVLKSCSLGRLLYPSLNRIYRLYSVPARRRNMRKNGYEVLDKVYQISEEHGVKCFAIFGSLLGCVREGGFIPHDSDIDFGVLGPVTPSELTRIFVEENGFEFLHAFSYHEVIIEVTLKYKGVPIDFMFYHVDDEKSWCTVCNWSRTAPYTDPRQNSVKHVNQARITELKTIRVHGARVRIPANYEDVLVSVFGKGWKVPDPSFKPSQQPGNVYLSDFGYIEPYKTVMSEKLGD